MSGFDLSTQEGVDALFHKVRLDALTARANARTGWSAPAGDVAQFVTDLESLLFAAYQTGRLPTPIRDAMRRDPDPQDSEHPSSLADGWVAVPTVKGRRRFWQRGRRG